MDIDALIAAAKEIDRKVALKEKRWDRMEELAALVRNHAATAHARGEATREYRALSINLITIGDEINNLRAALRKPCEEKQDSPT